MSDRDDQDRLSGPNTFRHDPGRPADEPGTQRMISLLDLQDTSPAVVRLRQWALAKVQPQPGETAVDVGSGSGTVTRLLADLVGEGGRAVGVEPNDQARAEAERRAAQPRSKATFVPGVAAALPIDDATVDLVWCERVLQHLDDPQAAVTEMARVLRPSGRAVVIDSDHATRITSDLDDEVEAKFNRQFLSWSPNARAARHVPRQLRDAGLRMDPDVGSAALILPAAEEQAAVLIRMVADDAVRAGVVTAAEAEKALASYRAAAAEGVAFSSVTMFAFVARLP